MKKIHFLFGIHNHQPVGNFDHVFSQAFATSYKPFLKLLEKYPSVRTALHFSGPLLEWMDAQEPDSFGLVQKLVERNQVELMSGGMYEPIFSVIREKDIKGQITMMNDFIRQRFAAEPQGAWIAERVWDPVLPRLITEAGLRYTLLDSTHFLHTGLSPEQIRGYYVTEREGKTLAVFPIDMKLRYTIPFEPPEKTIEYLLYMASEDQQLAVTYGDDGEKFGMWPGTYNWVYEQGWLESFFRELEKNRNKIKMVTFSEYLDMQPPEGLIYLPTLSYEEMMEWSLPAEAVIRYDDMLENLRNLELKEKYSSFVSGGYWNNFLAKYPESNHMHKKMLFISERLDALEQQGGGEAADIDAARRELYRGQCNCPYWHGLFGGIYLNYLRHAVYEHLINAENIIDGVLSNNGAWIDYRVTDFKRDLSREVIVAGQGLNAYFSLRDGGGLFELDFRPRSFNLSNVLTRKMEGYHRNLKRNNGPDPAAGDEDQPVSIHHISKVKEEGLENMLTYDWYQRYSFLDHFLGEGTSLESFSMSRYPELGNFINAPYSLETIDKDPNLQEVTFVLSRDGSILQDDKHMPVRVSKQFRVNDRDRSIETVYAVENKSEIDLDLWFGVECNLTLLAGEDPLRYYHISGEKEQELYMNTRTECSAVTSFAMKDDWNGFGLDFSLSRQAGLWLFPLETVSQSEDGFERTYQGSSMLMHWKLHLTRGEQKQQSIFMRLYEYTGEKQKNESA